MRVLEELPAAALQRDFAGLQQVTAVAELERRVIFQVDSSLVAKLCPSVVVGCVYRTTIGGASRQKQNGSGQMSPTKWQIW